MGLACLETCPVDSFGRLRDNDDISSGDMSSDDVGSGSNAGDVSC